MEHMKGFELLFALVEDQIQSKKDCLVLALHNLIINSDLECYGIGDQWPESITNSGSEMLPEGWNSDQEMYSLRYMNKSQSSRYLLKAILSNDMMIVTVVKDDNAVGTMLIKIDEHIADDHSKFSSTYLNLSGLVQSFTKDVMSKFQSDNPGHSRKKKNTSDAQEPPAQPSRLRIGAWNEDDTIPGISSPQVGGADLDPFGRGRGGMLVDPSSMGMTRPSLGHFGIGGPRGLPRGSVPPGARFDPIGPPVPGLNRRGPDPDHLPMPGYDEFI